MSGPVSSDSTTHELQPRAERHRVMLGALIERFGHGGATRHRVRDLSTTGVRVDQAERLQRMLVGAGITPEQLDFLGELTEPDSRLRAELWALKNELRWNLRASAAQLRRRWRSGAGAQPFPIAVAAWLDDVERLDSEN